MSAAQTSTSKAPARRTKKAAAAQVEPAAALKPAVPEWERVYDASYMAKQVYQRMDELSDPHMSRVKRKSAQWGTSAAGKLAGFVGGLGGAVTGLVGWGAVADGVCSSVVPLSGAGIAAATAGATWVVLGCQVYVENQVINARSVGVSGNKLMSLAQYWHKEAVESLALLRRVAPELAARLSETNLEHELWAIAELCREAHQLEYDAQELSERTRSEAGAAALAARERAWERSEALRELSVEARELAHSVDAELPVLATRIQTVLGMGEGESSASAERVEELRALREALEILQRRVSS